MERDDELEGIVRKHGIAEFRWLDPREIVVGQWVRMKCLFGCGEYGRNGTCPPNTPPVAECERFFREYGRAMVFRFEKTVARPEDRHPWTRRVNAELLALERAVFLAGRERAFLLFMDSCTLCGDCTGRRETCREPRRARPTPEAMAVDVFATVRKLGWPIQVLDACDRPMNRYAFLLID